MHVGNPSLCRSSRARCSARAGGDVLGWLRTHISRFLSRMQKGRCGRGGNGERCGRHHPLTGAWGEGELTFRQNLILARFRPAFCGEEVFQLVVQLFHLISPLPLSHLVRFSQLRGTRIRLCVPTPRRIRTRPLLIFQFTQLPVLKCMMMMLHAQRSILPILELHTQTRSHTTRKSVV